MGHGHAGFVKEALLLWRLLWRLLRLLRLLRLMMIVVVVPLSLPPPRPRPSYLPSPLPSRQGVPHRYFTVTPPLHHRYITVTSPLHHRYVTVTSPLRHDRVSLKLLAWEKLLTEYPRYRSGYVLVQICLGSRNQTGLAPSPQIRAEIEEIATRINSVYPGAAERQHSVGSGRWPKL